MRGGPSLPLPPPGPAAASARPAAFRAPPSAPGLRFPSDPRPAPPQRGRPRSLLSTGARCSPLAPRPFPPQRLLRWHSQPPGCAQPPASAGDGVALQGRGCPGLRAAGELPAGAELWPGAVQPQAGLSARGCRAVSQQVWWGRLVSSRAVFPSAFRNGVVRCGDGELGMDRSDSVGGCQRRREFWLED